jgi:hypothetical protein
LAIDEAQPEILIEQGDTFAHVVEHGLHESMTLVCRAASGRIFWLPGARLAPPDGETSDELGIDFFSDPHRRRRL